MMPCEEKFIESIYTKAGVNHGTQQEKKDALKQFEAAHLSVDERTALNSFLVPEEVKVIIEALGDALGSLKQNDALLAAKTFINKALTAAHKLAGTPQ